MMLSFQEGAHSSRWTWRSRFSFADLYTHTPDLAFVEPGPGPETLVSRAQQGQARQTS